MKITCGSCGAKYTVSDEKVHGKTVKVKCRKCSAVIVVSSTGEVQTTGGTAGAGAVAGGDMTFTVSVSDTDQRNMTMAEVVAAYNEGLIDAETYVWSEGMDDWQPLKDVDMIVDALHDAAEAEPAPGSTDLGSTVAMDQAPSPYSQPPAAYSQPPPAYSQPPAAAGADYGDYGSPAAGGYGDYGSPSTGGADYRAPATGGRAPMPVAAAPAAQTSSPFDVSGSSSYGGGSSNDGGFFSMSSSPSLGASAPTGTEENSAIFSLNMLTAKVGGDDAPSTSGGRSNTEDSGLIDLKALAAGMGGDSEGVAAVASGPAADGVFPLGAPPPIASAMASPSIPAPQQSSNRGIVIGLGAAVAVLAAALIFFIVKDSGEDPSAKTDNSADTTKSADTGAPAPPPPAPEPMAGPQPSSQPSSEPVADSSAAPEDSSKVAVGPRPVTGPRPPTPPTPGGPAPAPAPTPKTTTGGTTGGGTKGPCGCASDDLMCHMRCSGKQKKKK